MYNLRSCKPKGYRSPYSSEWDSWIVDYSAYVLTSRETAKWATCSSFDSLWNSCNILDRNFRGILYRLV